MFSSRRQTTAATLFEFRALSLPFFTIAISVSPAVERKNEFIVCRLREPGKKVFFIKVNFPSDKVDLVNICGKVYRVGGSNLRSINIALNSKSRSNGKPLNRNYK